jgi:peptidyl-prolyl cis-trans isomerase C
MKRTAGSSLAKVVLVCLLLWSATTAVAETQPVSEEVVAVVDDRQILRPELQEVVAALRAHLVADGLEPDEQRLAALEKEALEKLINRELLIREADRRNLHVPPEQVAQKLTEVKKRFPGAEDYHDLLQRLALSEEEFASRLAQDLDVERLLEQVTTGVETVSNQEAKDYYDRHPEAFTRSGKVRARHILIQVDPEAGEAEKARARSRIEKISRLLRSGSSFEQLAGEYSEGPNADRGGNLGVFERGELIAEFEAAAFALEPGELSEIVETRYGYHLIEVLTKEPDALIPFRDVRDRLAADLATEKRRLAVEAFIGTLKAAATVTRML